MMNQRFHVSERFDTGDNGGDISKISISTEMKRSYLDYAMSVIVSRAIPDVCDGCKPVHRRILYAMYESGYDYNKPFKKSARIVGEVMGKYHPHGDAALYGSLVRMAQPFAMGITLIDGQGNFGSIDDDPPAAMRYTESRLSKIAHTLLDDLDKDTVDFVPNYDGSEHEPMLLPARFPNLLVNGGSGIAVGLATNIPPHNLGEVIDALIAYIDNPDLTFEELIAIIPAPDFPTGGIMLGRTGWNNAVRSGRGSITIRGRVKIEDIGKGKKAIIITEVPYGVNKALMVEKIADLVKEKKVDGITDLRDETDKDGIRVVIELRRDAREEVILNQLYNYTPLQSTFGINTLALNHGRPEQLSTLDVIKIFTEFRKTVVTRRTNYLLRKVRERAHILIGLHVAVANIDEVIAIIKSCPDSAAAKIALLQHSWSAVTVKTLIELVQDKGNRVQEDSFHFTEEQARAILDMKLARLTGLESGKIEEELNGLAGDIKKFLEILADDQLLMSIVRNELLEIKEEYAQPRLTTIEDSEFERDDESLIAKEDMVVVATMNGYIKSVPLNSYRAQRRGGKGKAGMGVNDDDVTKNIFIADTHTAILFFSDRGRVYKLKTYRLPQGGPQSKGRALVNLLNIGQDEKITTILPLPYTENELSKLNIVFATKQGNIRRNSMLDFIRVQANGKRAIRLEEGDSLVGVSLCCNDDDILLNTHNGKCIRFPVESIRVFKGRDSSGVRGIKLGSNNYVISLAILKNAGIDILTRESYLKIPVEQRIALKEYLLSQQQELTLADITRPRINTLLAPEQVDALALKEQFIITLTEKGYGKCSSAYEYRITNRGGSGVTSIVTTSKNGHVVESFIVDKDDHLILITNKGTVLRTRTDAVRITGRSTQGVILMKMKSDDEHVVAIAKVAAADDDELEDETSSSNDIAMATTTTASSTSANIIQSATQMSTNKADDSTADSE